MLYKCTFKWQLADVATADGVLIQADFLEARQCTMQKSRWSRQQQPAVSKHQRALLCRALRIVFMQTQMKGKSSSHCLLVPLGGWIGKSIQSWNCYYDPAFLCIVCCHRIIISWHIRENNAPIGL